MASSAIGGRREEAVKRGEPPRREGGERIRDPERTRGNILKAATVEFSEHGFAGTSIDSIAARSGANKRMIYHYFGNKRGLWLATLEAAYERARSAEQQLHLDELDPETAMATLAGFTFDSFVDDRTFINLLNSENLHQARHLKESSRIKSMHSPLIGMIQKILDRGVEQGIFRPGIDPAQLWISIAGLAFFYFSNVFTLSVILDRDLGAAEDIQERRAHVIELINKGIRAETGQ